jgi:hypothetical protein
MGDTVSTFGQILRASVNIKFYLYMILLMVLTMVLGVLTVIAGIIVGGVIFLVGLMVYGLMAFSLPALLIYFILSVIALLLFVLLGAFVDAVIEGLGINLCWDFLSGKKLDLSAALKRMQPRLVDAVKLRFYVWLIVGIVIIVLIAIPFLLALPAMGGFDVAVGEIEDFLVPFAGVMIFEIILLLAIALAAFFLVPFSVILFQIPFFEKKSPRECVDRAIALGKKNYWRNMGYYLLMVIVLVFVFMFAGVFGFITGMFAAVMDSDALMALALIIFIFFGIVMFVVRILLQIWALGLSQLFLTSIYFLNTGKKVVKPKDVKLKF